MDKDLPRIEIKWIHGEADSLHIHDKQGGTYVIACFEDNGDLYISDKFIESIRAKIMPKVEPELPKKTELIFDKCKNCGGEIDFKCGHWFHIEINGYCCQNDKGFAEPENPKVEKPIRFSWDKIPDIEFNAVVDFVKEQINAGFIHLDNLSPIVAEIINEKARRQVIEWFPVEVDVERDSKTFRCIRCKTDISFKDKHILLTDYMKCQKCNQIYRDDHNNLNKTQYMCYHTTIFIKGD